MTTSIIGTHDGENVERIEIENGNGLRASLITFGARLTELWVPDRAGEAADIVLGFDDLQSYVDTNTYFGATCGRYGNRITKGRFSLFGHDYQVDVNEGNNHLHGGAKGFDRKVWKAESTGSSVVFTSRSDDGEMGFPGACDLKAVYKLTDDNGLEIEMIATTDAPTVMNMVHHSYFNLAGQGSGNVLDQQIRLHGRFYVPIDGELMPTGEILSVADTPFDFRSPKPIGKDIDDLESIGAGVFDEGGGYDHNWCLDGAGMRLRPCAEAFDPFSGRRMVMQTTEPGVQFYTGGYLSEKITGKRGAALCKYAGFTLETQKFPDAPNFAHFPDCILMPGETYHQKMVFKFTAE